MVRGYWGSDGGLGEVFRGLLFAAAATSGMGFVGWMGALGALPGLDGPAFVGTLSERGAAVLGAWMAVAAIVSLALPALTLVVWGRYAAVRGALLGYVVVLGVQIAVEVIFAGVFFPNIVVLTGIVFTGYRLRQLLRAARRFALAEAPSGVGRAAVRWCLRLGLAFWSANLAFLILVALPRAVQVA